MIFSVPIAVVAETNLPRRNVSVRLFLANRLQFRCTCKHVVALPDSRAQKEAGPIDLSKKHLAIKNDTTQKIGD